MKENNRLQIQYFTEIGPNREQNQDNFFVKGIRNSGSRERKEGSVSLCPEECNVIAVFDGMGGETSGEIASFLASEEMDILEEQLHPDTTAEDLEKALKYYYGLFMERLENSLEDEYTVCGTTCAGVVCIQERILPFWMGDSRVYLLRDGKLTQLTKDHSLAQRKIDRGLITEADARKTPDWNTIYSYMGKYEAEFSVAAKLEICRGDRLFLCTDGISDMYGNEELEKLLQTSLQKVMAVLNRDACTKAKDNCTAICIDVQEASVGSNYLKVYRRIRECLQSLWKNKR